MKRKVIFYSAFAIVCVAAIVVAQKYSFEKVNELLTLLAIVISMFAFIKPEIMKRVSKPILRISYDTSDNHYRVLEDPDRLDIRITVENKDKETKAEKVIVEAVEIEDTENREIVNLRGLRFKVSNEEVHSVTIPPDGSKCFDIAVVRARNITYIPLILLIHKKTDYPSSFFSEKHVNREGKYRLRLQASAYNTDSKVVKDFWIDQTGRWHKSVKEMQAKGTSFVEVERGANRR